MKIDWRFVLVLVAALITIIALKTQTENLDGDVEETEETEKSEETEETEETKEPEPTYPDVSGFVADISNVNGKIKFMDIAMIEGVLDNINVTTDPKSFGYCSKNCNQETFTDPDRKDEQDKCKTDCDNYITGVCKTRCAIEPGAPECDTICASYLE
jgi:hypothetical protein